ncbi:MAG: phasin family protein [Xanthomonadales bacterium]|nr:phasin family protein [Xanthomonadales bacterium]
MTQVNDFFKPDVLFSAGNPLLTSIRQGHQLMFETFDKAARVQLTYAEELLDVNRKQFELLYAGKSLKETVADQQDLATEWGKHAAKCVGDLQEVAVELQAGVSEAANDMATPEAGNTRTKKTKSA